LDEADIAAASWAWTHDRPAGRGADTLPGARRLYLPLVTGRTAVGVIGLDSDKLGSLLTAEQQRLLDALAHQAAVSIERIQLVSDVDRAKLAAEADRLRSALLTSISHDLKTPLAGIMGAAGALRELAPSLPDEARAELLLTVLEESDRLNLFIANLLDMTKLETGAVHPNSTHNYVGDVVGSVLRRVSKIVANHKIEIQCPSDLPMLRIDPVLFEQVLFNLIDNAAKYTPEGSKICVRGWRDGEAVKVEIMDEGPGIPEADLTRIFDSFYRVQRTDQTRAGTGLGLSICKGFIEAMGGTIKAANRNDRAGAIFTITMPVSTEPPKLDDLT
jgi:two-component system sensor histidine kinase KdpD